ncbi:beta-lactamase-like protein [Filobasidium floriforme]|uniref:beta-lactamase-like protein n=1 Tax=Filobasidium floriforme TaxID=5210 RepID=UPI001E8CF04A|nr:beta-lactamase-like protein [Filobasidium floriforme]KAH8080931.1 beta-lactamase-like protein [Filobasidium floriforme]
MSADQSSNQGGLEPVRPETYTFHAIPGSADKNAKVAVHQIPTGELTAPAGILADVHGSKDDLTVPAYSYLIEKDGQAYLWDLGLMEVRSLLPLSRRIRDVMLTKLFKANPGPGPIKRLREGGYDTGKIKEVILSHQHFDHFGDLDTLASGVKVVLGPGSLASIGPGYPEDPDGSWPKKWLDEKQLEELPPVDVGSSAPSIRGKWQQVACFEHALDYFGDGSLWLAINEGASHCRGHLNALARVTTDPDTYLVLAGDTAHHQSLYLPVPAPGEVDRRTRIPFFEMPNTNGSRISMHENPTEAYVSIGRLSRMSMEENIMVLLAHEGQVKGVIPDWPESLDNWKANGFKEKKENPHT